MTTQPRWPPFAEPDGEVEKELQAHGTRLLEMVCDSHTYDEATRAQLLSNLPAWATDIESLKTIYTRTIELRAKKHPKGHQAAFIASHRPMDRIPCIQVHVEKIRPNIGDPDLMLRKEAFGRREYGLRLFNITYGFRYSNFSYQKHEDFGCLVLKICLYDDTVAYCGLGSSSGPYNVQTPLIPDCEAAVTQWKTFADQDVTSDSGLYNTRTWRSHLARWVPPILADDAEFVLKVAHKYGRGILPVVSDRLRNDETTVARLIEEGVDLSDRTIGLWTKNVRLARLALDASWKVEAWRQLYPEVRDELGDVCPAPFASIEALQENNEWMFASPELVATDEFAIACFLGNLSNLYDHSPELYVKAAKMPPPANELSCATAHDQQDRDHSEDYWFWWRMYAWVEHGNDAVVSHTGAMAELARHLATAELAPSAYMFRPKRLGAAMGTIPGLQRVDVLDKMLRRVETTATAKTVVDLALAFLDAVAKTTGVDRFTDTHVDRLGTIAGALGGGRETSQTTALAVVPEKEPSTTLELSKRFIILEQWERRRDLHHSSTKAYRDLSDKCAVLRKAYERELAAWRGKQLMIPARRIQANKRRAETMAQRHEETIQRIVAAVQGLAKVKDTDMLTAAITDALTPPPAQKKRKKKATKAKPMETVEEDDDDSD